MEDNLNRAESQSLRRLAEVHGIQTTYVDVQGRKQHARPEALTALLQTLGVQASNRSELRDALHDAEQQQWQSWLEPVSILQGRGSAIPFRIPRALEKKAVRLRLQMESGENREWEINPADLKTFDRHRSGKAFYLSKQLIVPRIPHGYHELEVELGGQHASTMVVSAPEHSYTDESLKRCWGGFLPMYAAHDSRSWGGGGFREWEELGAWLGSQGAQILGSLPIMAAFLDENFCDPSPYSPVSRLFWNEYFLDPLQVSGFAECKKALKLTAASGFERALHSFRNGALVDYRGEMALKRRVLEELARFFFSRSQVHRGEFEQFAASHPHLESYARFRATVEKRKEPWQQWPERLRNGKLRNGDFDAERRDYHLYVQWQAQRQMDQLLERLKGHGVKFYLDLPLGVHPSGYDVWREQRLFANGASVGAPPDAFFTKGQNWGFSPLHPRRMREDRYRHFLEVLRFQMRHTGLLRIDHVMALRRLYWIPHGHSAQDGAYVSYPARELFALLSLESHRNKTVLVGENLGTVPPEINAAMARSHMRQMYVLQYELKPNARKALAAPVKRCVASLNTHDMPTFASFAKSHDIDDRLDLGLIGHNELEAERRRREKLLASLARFLRSKGWLSASRSGVPALLEGSLKFLSASDAEIVLLNLEDLWGEEQPQNTPGTCAERDNWVRKGHVTLEQMKKMRSLRKLLKIVDGLRSDR